MKRSKRNSFRRAAMGFIFACAILAFSVLFAQQDGPVYIQAKKIYTSDGGIILANGGFLVKDGKIVRVDRNAKPPKNAQVVDFSKNIIIPGMIDAFSHMGFHKEDYNVRTEPPDPPRAPLTGIYRIYFGQQTTPAPPLQIETRFEASEAVYFGDPSFKRFMAEGITMAVIAIPTANLSGGMPFMAKLGSDSPSGFEMVDPAGLVFTFSGNGNVMKRYGDLHKIFKDAQDYRKIGEK